ncbi:MAG: fimbrillin family protein [Bacteroidales bacterium]|nr:fimbrillin family protein [Bacteroidales bacterium]
MKRIITISILGLLLLSACTKNRFLSTERIAPISLTANFGAAATKATITDDNITSETIRVQVAKSNGTDSYAVEDSKYKLTYGGLNWSLSNMLYLSAENAKIYAYAPTPEDPTTVETNSYNTLKRRLDIPATQQMANQVDFLWCYQDKTVAGGAIDINSTNPNVSLTMKHALSQIAFVIYGENYNGTGAINSVKVKDITATPALRKMKNAANDLYMNVADGTNTGGETTTEISATSIAGSILTTQPSADIAELKLKVNAYLLIVPTSVTNKNNVQFTFNIDNKEYNVSLTGGGPITWVAGQQYIYTVKLSGTQMNIISVTVTPWSSSHEGEVVIN